MPPWGVCGVHFGIGVVPHRLLDEVRDDGGDDFIPQDFGVFLAVGASFQHVSDGSQPGQKRLVPGLVHQAGYDVGQHFRGGIPALDGAERVYRGGNDGGKRFQATVVEGNSPQPCHVGSPEGAFLEVGFSPVFGRAAGDEEFLLIVVFVPFGDGLQGKVGGPCQNLPRHGGDELWFSGKGEFPALESS